MQLGLLKKYRHRSNLTACALKFTQTVEADSYVRPSALRLHNSNRPAPLGFGSHKLDGVRFRLCKRIALREGMLALPYGVCRKFVQTRHNHPVRLRLPPLQKKGMVRPYG